MMQMELLNQEYGVKPIIAEGASISGVLDCIHQIIIEKDAFTGHNVAILTGGHDYTKFGEERKRSTTGGPITIKEGAWIGSFAIIIGKPQGITIGRHSVIGAGSVVTKNVPDYEVWAGSPAHFVKRIIHD